MTFGIAMDISLFDYTYPPDLVAQHPPERRDDSRLMVLDRKRGSIEHRRFREFLEYFKNDLLVANDVKVLPTRLYGETEKGRKVEVLLLAEVEKGHWECLVRPANKLKSLQTIFFGGVHLQGIVKRTGDKWSIRFDPSLDLMAILEEIGLPPLPPYIKRKEPFREIVKDRERYQTIYARKMLGAAAPTAGFHFTRETMEGLKNKGTKICFCTLQVGRDTFEPVRTKNIKEHVMHGECYEIPEETAGLVTKAKKEGRSITAIGTTVVRALESAWEMDRLGEGAGHTTAFFYPGYRFKVVDRLLTNFHQPRSTLLMLVSAFAGREFILEAYRQAIREKYRLFSFGDAMLIL